MNKNEGSCGWGAFQNLRKENQNLKKEIIIQNENSYGERISIDKYNNFKNLSSRVNPFRFPDSIKNEVLEKEYEKKDEKKDEKNEVLINNEEKKEVLINNDEKKEQENDNIEDENEYKVYKKLILKKIKQIDELSNQNLNYKNEYETKIKILEEEYKLNILNNNTKINKIQTHIDNLEKIIETNIDLSNVDLTNDENSVISENILIKLEEEEGNEGNEVEKQNKTSKKRPETIKGCFNTNTIIRHKKSKFEEFCIYVVNEVCLFRCDQNGNYDKNSIRYSKLNQFTSDNYKKNFPNRTQRNNAYVETEYLCKISNIFLPLIDLQKGTIYN